MNEDRSLSCPAAQYDADIYLLTGALCAMCFVVKTILVLLKRVATLQSTLVLMAMMYGIVAHFCMFALPGMFVLRSYGSRRCTPILQVVSWLTSAPLLVISMHASGGVTKLRAHRALDSETVTCALIVMAHTSSPGSLKCVIMVLMWASIIYSRCAALETFRAVQQGRVCGFLVLAAQAVYVVLPLTYSLGELGWISTQLELSSSAVGDVILKIAHMMIVGYSELDPSHAAHSTLGKKQTQTFEKMFLRYVFHEIRNPLACLGAAIDDIDVHEGDVMYVSHLRSGMRSLGKLLDDLKELIELQEGKVTLDESMVNMQAVVANCISRLTNCHEFIVGSHRAHQPSLCVVGDEYRLGQMVCAALFHCHQHSDHGVPVHVSLDQGGAYRDMVEVKMSLTMQAGNDASRSAFEMSTVKLCPETILPDLQLAYSFGLRLAEYVLDMYDGSLVVDEDLDSRTTVVALSLFLPKFVAGDFQLRSLPPQHPQHIADKARLPNATQARDAAGAKRVLIIDDSKLQVKLLERVCRSCGVLPDAAFDGLEGSCMVAEKGAGHYCAIFCDIVMPGLNGVEATRRIREVDNDVPVYALSANGFKTDFDEILSAGATAGYSKPVPRDTIVGLLKAAMDGDGAGCKQ